QTSGEAWLQGGAQAQASGSLRSDRAAPPIEIELKQTPFGDLRLSLLRHASSGPELLRSLHVALRRPETMKRTSAIIKMEEGRRQSVDYLSFKLVEELDPSRTDVPETVSPTRAGRTLGRMPPIVSTPAVSSCDARLKSLVTSWSDFDGELRHSTESGNWA